MKKIWNICSLLSLSLLAVSCGLDNYDEPESFLEGKITYEGKQLGLKGTNGGIQLQLYQDGYANHNAINVYATQDGTFSAVLFDGPYKLVTKDKNGPWVNKRDTIYIEVKGKTLCEVKVTPYFTISDENIALNNNTVSGTCNIQQIVQDSKISQVMLLVSQTTFVDENTNIGRQNLSNIAPGTTNISLDITNNKNVQSAKALFARIGAKATGADQAIYSEIFRLK